VKILMSIKPQYAERIFSGDKLYEYRKTIFKNSNVMSIVVYTTKPVGKIIGEFEIGEVICDTPENIWNKTKKYAGIEKVDYDKYFSDRKKAYAIQVKSKKLYETPINLEDIKPSIKYAPQSFMYI
jgi:predicted transcriptional regulator